MEQKRKKEKERFVYLRVAMAEAGIKPYQKGIPPMPKANPAEGRAAESEELEQTPMTAVVDRGEQSETKTKKRKHADGSKDPKPAPREHLELNEAGPSQHTPPIMTDTFDQSNQTAVDSETASVKKKKTKKEKGKRDPEPDTNFPHESDAIPQDPPTSSVAPPESATAKERKHREKVEVSPQPVPSSSNHASTSQTATVDPEEDERHAKQERQRLKREKRERRERKEQRRLAREGILPTPVGPSETSIDHAAQTSRRTESHVGKEGIVENAINHVEDDSTAMPLQAFPFLQSPEPPDENLLAKQGLPSGLQDAVFVDQNLRTPVADFAFEKDDSERRLSALLLGRLKDLGIHEFFAGEFACGSC